MVRNILVFILLISCFSCEKYESWKMERMASEKEREEEKLFHSLLQDPVEDGEDPLAKPLSARERKRLQERLDDSLQTLYQEVGLNNYDLPYDVFKMAMTGYFNLRQEEELSEKPYLSIIDFTKSGCDKRFYTIDLEEHEVEFHEYVSHGQNTGGNFAEKFSNVPDSYTSSLGFYVTGETYHGSKGYSLRLDGVEEGVNEKVRERGIIIHQADYVTEDFIDTYGRLGRSQGCPALSPEVNERVIKTIKGKTAIFAYYDAEEYLQESEYISFQNLMEEGES